MVALPCPLGDFHIAQQGVHLGERELAIGVDRTATGDVAEQSVRGGFEMVRAAVIEHITHHRTYERRRIDAGEQRRHRAHHESPRAEQIDVESRAREFFKYSFERVGFVHRELDDRRRQ